MVQNCNYDENYVQVIIGNKTIGYVQEVEITEEQETSSELYFGGVAEDVFKYPKITININRLIRYNMTEESEVLNLLNCMKTDPKTITLISQHTASDEDTLTVSRSVEMFKNCRLSSNKRTLKAGEAYTMELEFHSEGRIYDNSNPTWSTVNT